MPTSSNMMQTYIQKENSNALQTTGKSDPSCCSGVRLSSGILSHAHMHACANFKPDPGCQWPPMFGGGLTGQRSRENRADGIFVSSCLSEPATTACMHERMCTGRIATFPAAVQSYAIHTRRVAQGCVYSIQATESFESDVDVACSI
jgi:hypothetical protein